MRIGHGIVAGAFQGGQSSSRCSHTSTTTGCSYSTASSSFSAISEKAIAQRIIMIIIKFIVMIVACFASVVLRDGAGASRGSSSCCSRRKGGAASTSSSATSACAIACTATATASTAKRLVADDCTGQQRVQGGSAVPPAHSRSKPLHLRRRHHERPLHRVRLLTGCVQQGFGAAHGVALHAGDQLCLAQLRLQKGDALA